jgi:hypothetical protein
MGTARGERDGEIERLHGSASQRICDEGGGLIRNARGKDTGRPLAHQAQGQQAAEFVARSKHNEDQRGGNKHHSRARGEDQKRSREPGRFGDYGERLQQRKEERRPVGVTRKGSSPSG